MGWMRRTNREWLSEHATYQEKGEARWRCKTTNEPIMIQETGRSIWKDGPGPCAGNGEVRVVMEAYCPRCASAPDIQHGSPIQEDELIRV